MAIDWPSKLRHMLQTMVFCVGVATVQYAFMPERPYAPPVVYSMAIGLITWAVIDLGRELFPSSQETGWPGRWQGLSLVAVGIAAGYFLGTTLADAACRTFGWYAVSPVPRTQLDLRQSLLITTLAGVVGTYYFYNKTKSAYLLRKMNEAQQHANNARLKLLESQLQPHMLFNTLANLRALIATNPSAAQDMLDRLTAYLRATLTASRHGEGDSSHSLQAEFDRLGDYLALMAVRMGPRLVYRMDLPAELVAQPVPPLLLQPLVENSIQHGLEPQVAGGSITISARRQGALLLLQVQDTGVGLTDYPSQASGSGFGLTQVRERLATLYGDQAAIEIVAAPAGGTCGSITFPLKT
jgi:signal transduction histidine kinase